MASISATADAARGETTARTAERLLRLAGDVRVALALIVLAAAANLVAAFQPLGASVLEGWPYAVLLGAVALSSVASTIVRMPATWREWRRPGRVAPRTGALDAVVETRVAPEVVAAVLAAAGYRVRLERRPGQRRWAVHGVRRGWSRFAGQASHLGLVLVVVGAAIGAAYGSETTFSLMAGDQALLDAPRTGFSSAVRLDSFDAAFGADGRPERLDANVTFLRAAEAVESRVVRVNEPGAFDGYLVHPWTYGPAVRVRVTTLAGSPLVHAPIPLDGERDGLPVGGVELPTRGVTLGLALADAAANEVGVSVVGPDGLVGTARLRPGGEARVGDLLVRLDGFDAWVTFLSRRDPGVGVLFAGAFLLSAALAIGFWLPRRRLSVTPVEGGVRVVLRGERFDRPRSELARVSDVLGRHS